MSKKQKKVKAERTPTKHQLSKWQRHRRTNRIIIIAASVFLAGILGYVGHGYYNGAIKPFREIVINVNDTSFNMGYYVDMLDAQTKDLQPNEFYAELVASRIEQAELIRQGANDLGIHVEKGEVSEKIKDNKLPTSKIYQDMVTVELLADRLLDYFGSQLPDKMEQVNVRLMLVEGREVANNVLSQLEAGGDFATLLEEFSPDPQAGGDLGWVPEEFLPSIIADTIPDTESGEIKIIYDNSLTKNVGYWLIKVTDKDEEKGIYAHVMLLGSEEEAEELKARLDDGEDFAQLAKQYSQHESKDTGGDLGWIKEGDLGSKAFDEVAFNLELNKVSSPVKDNVSTQGGHWVVEVLDKGEQELSEKVKQTLEREDFDDWFSMQEEISTVDNYLDEAKMSWAVLKVLQRR
ncbi:MAG: peptidylprolyl isomerase [Chloroflexota bacterium]|nr:peptidylprolyl isomerase [Chloroflexota bacterium]